MADAAIVTTAKTVVDQLNNNSWSQQFKAERKYKPTLSLEKARNLTVQVAMAAWRLAPDNRTDWSHEFEIDIGFVQRPDPKTGGQAIDAFDKLMTLVEEVIDFFCEVANRPTDGGTSLIGVVLGIVGGKTYITDFIETENQFTSIVKLTYRKIRDPSA